MIVNSLDILNKVQNLLKEDHLPQIKKSITKISESVQIHPATSIGQIHIRINGSATQLNKEVLLKDLNQILETQTLERIKYYIKRLVKNISEEKTGKINDLNLNRWKEYGDILTDSLWYLDKRDSSGAHSAGYWGNFIPQIPHQLLQRYTKRGEWVLDAFLGSGTTLIECKRLGRNGIGVELQKRVAQSAVKAIEQEEDLFSTKSEIMVADSSTFDFKAELKKRDIKSVQFLIMHPPYWDIIKFSEDKRSGFG